MRVGVVGGGLAAPRPAFTSRTRPRSPAKTSAWPALGGGAFGSGAAASTPGRASGPTVAGDEQEATSNTTSSLAKRVSCSESTSMPPALVERQQERSGTLPGEIAGLLGERLVVRAHAVELLFLELLQIEELVLRALGGADELVELD